MVSVERAFKFMHEPSKVTVVFLQFTVTEESLYSTMPAQPSTTASRFEISSIIGSSAGLGKSDVNLLLCSFFKLKIITPIVIFLCVKLT